MSIQVTSLNLIIFAIQIRSLWGMISKGKPDLASMSTLIDLRSFDRKKMMMIFKQKIMIFHVLFWNTVYYPLSPFTECCSINQRKEELIDTREQNCCPFAGRTYNKTIEYCCGNRVEMVFNKNNKCCGPKNHLGKPYMDMASGCCTMPKVLPTSHYL